MAVGFETRGHIAIVTIDRPEARNAIDPATGEALVDAWRRFRDSADLRVAVLTGAGDEAFCAGADLRSVGEFYRSLTPVERLARAETEPGLGGLTRNVQVWKPVLAAVNGYCLAGGFELALACDIRIAAETATFGLPEVGWGIGPGARADPGRRADHGGRGPSPRHREPRGAAQRARAHGARDGRAHLPQRAARGAGGQAGRVPGPSPAPGRGAQARTAPGRAGPAERGRAGRAARLPGEARAGLPGALSRRP